MANIQISVSYCKDFHTKNLRKFYPVTITSMNHLADVITKMTWSPSIYINNHRCIENTIQTNLLALDYDTGSPRLNEMIIMLETEGIKHIVGTSLSHQSTINKDNQPCKAVDKYRVIIPMNNLPSTDIDQYHQQIEYFFNMWPYPDTQCKDPSRYYFKCKEIVSLCDGKKLDWIIPESLDVIRKRKIKMIEKKVKNAKSGKLPDRVSKFLNKGECGDSRRGTIYYVSCELSRFGWELENIIRVIYKAPFNKVGLSQADLVDLDRQIMNGYTTGRKDLERECDTYGPGKEESCKREAKRG